MNFTIRKLATVDEMLGSLNFIQELTPDVTSLQYRQMLQDMVPHNYFQVGVYEGQS